MQNKILVGFIALATFTIISCQQTENTQFATASSDAAVSANTTETIQVDSAGNLLQTKNIDNRLLIHKGHIELETKDSKPYINTLISKINAYGGHTNNYEISNQKNFKSTQDISTDSMYQIYEISPKAHLVMQLPIHKADTFVNSLMAMPGTILHLQLNEDDHTESYKIAEGIDKAIVQQKIKPSANGIENTISNRVQRDELAYKSKYFWCDVTINGTPYIVKEVVAKPSAYNSAFYLRAWKGIEQGIFWCSEFLVGLLYILPSLAIVFICVWGAKKLLKKYKAV
jgi:hypothetical protein